MKDIFCVAAFAGKVLCLMVFVSALKPDGSIGAMGRRRNPSTAGWSVRECRNAG
jgi:hypothetical protein